MSHLLTTLERTRFDGRESRELRARWLEAHRYNVVALPGSLPTALDLFDLASDATAPRPHTLRLAATNPESPPEPPRRGERSLPFVAGLNALLCHSARAAERVWCQVAAAPGLIVPTNAPFPSAQLAHLESQALMMECCSGTAYRFDRENRERGFLDAERIATLIDRAAGRVRYVWIELACNALAGQPVALSTLRSIREVTQARGVLLVLATSRLLTNSLLLQRRDPQLSGVAVVDIAALTLSLADVCVGSLSKEYDLPHGGMIAARDPALVTELAAAAALDGALLPAHEWPQIGQAIGRRLGDTRPLERRADQSQRIRSALCAAGLPGVLELAGHAVYIDAHSLRRSGPSQLHAAEAWSAHCFIEAGVRLAPAPTTPVQQTLQVALVRAAVPVDRYSNEELDQAAQRIVDAMTRGTASRLILDRPQVGFDSIAPHHAAFRLTTEPDVVGFSWGQVWQERCARFGPRPAMLAEDELGGFHAVSGADLYELIRDLAEGLTALGVVAGDRVAWRLGNCLEWIVLDAACLSLGAISVPLMPGLPVQRAAAVLQQVRPQVVVGERIDLSALIEASGPCEEDWAVPWTVTVPGSAGLECARSRSWEQLLELGRRTRRDESAWCMAISAPHGSDPASWVLTSGTGGVTQQVELTHGNLAAYVASFRWPFFAPRQLYFPLVADLNQSLGRNALYAALYNGSLTCVVPRSPEAAIDSGLLQRFPPACLVAPPRLLARCVERATRAVDGASGLPRERAARQAAALRAYFGGRLWFLAYGGAPLPATLERLFIECGFMLADGYGMTECPLVAIRHLRGDAVPQGHQLAPAVDVRIAPSGEIEIRGAGVASRLLGPSDTAIERWTTDGWLRTGDRGHWSLDGLVVEGRIQELIHLADGTHLDPSWLELQLESTTAIAQAIVIGDERPCVVALIVPRDSLSGDRTTAIAREVDGLNRTLSAAERVTRFALLDSPLPIELLGLTTSGEKRRVDRRGIDAQFAAEIEALYAVHSVPRAS